jgi:p-aminobenzoyl-glutamate transporter AbgT
MPLIGYVLTAIFYAWGEHPVAYVDANQGGNSGTFDAALFDSQVC